MTKRNKKFLTSVPTYLFVEGEKTEPAYFAILKSRLGIPNLQIFPAKGKSGNALLANAISQIKLGSLNPKAVKYLVFDKNSLTTDELARVFENARVNGFNIGFSNLNFEVWLLAHFEKLTKRPTSSSDKSMLENKLKNKALRCFVWVIAKILLKLSRFVKKRAHIDSLATKVYSNYRDSLKNVFISIV